MKNDIPRCAVVFKTYAWDEFIERQARRLEQAAGSLDFYISVDETGGSVGPIPFDRVIRFTCADLAAAGLPMRYGVGGVLWWNPDYAHYQFLEQQPDYDYYLFVEYDCVVRCELEQFVSRAASQGADLIAQPISVPIEKWHWMPYQCNAYRFNEIKLALLNVCFLSARGLRLLHQRRLSMNPRSSNNAWPSAEVFVPTEIAREGMTWIPLAECGDVSQYEWFPPTLEEDLMEVTGDAFLHPVLDRKRYISSMLHHVGCLEPGELDRVLARFKREEYAKLLWSSARQRAVRRVQHRLIRWWNQVRSLFHLRFRRPLEGD